VLHATYKAGAAVASVALLALYTLVAVLVLGKDAVAGKPEPD
jgi:hypothetical protein